MHVFSNVNCGLYEYISNGDFYNFSLVVKYSTSSSMDTLNYLLFFKEEKKNGIFLFITLFWKVFDMN